MRQQRRQRILEGGASIKRYVDNDVCVSADVTQKRTQKSNVKADAEVDAEKDPEEDTE